MTLVYCVKVQTLNRQLVSQSGKINTGTQTCFSWGEEDTHKEEYKRKRSVEGVWMRYKNTDKREKKQTKIQHRKYTNTSFYELSLLTRIYSWPLLFAKCSFAWRYLSASRTVDCNSFSSSSDSESLPFLYDRNKNISCKTQIQVYIRTTRKKYVQW